MAKQFTLSQRSPTLKNAHGLFLTPDFLIKNAGEGEHFKLPIRSVSEPE